MLRLDGQCPGFQRNHGHQTHGHSLGTEMAQAYRLLNNFTPRSVMLKPPTVLSKLNADRLVIVCQTENTADHKFSQQHLPTFIPLRSRLVPTV